MRRAERAGLGLVEVLVAAAIASVLMVTLWQVVASGARHGRDMAGLDRALTALDRARTRFLQDAQGVPDAGEIEHTPSRLRLSLPVDFEDDGRVRTHPVEYRVSGPAGDQWLLRQGQPVAGPFREVRFEVGDELVGVAALRLVMVADTRPGRPPVALTAEAPLPRPRRPAGLRDWRD